MVADYDPCIQPESGHEVAGLGGELAQSANEGDPLPSDHYSRSRDPARTETENETRGGTSGLRDAHQSEKEDTSAMRYELNHAMRGSMDEGVGAQRSPGG